MKESADEVLADLGVKDPLLDIAKELEQVALADDYFIERKLYPNVDFYTGVIYKAMGFPTRMFTVLFAIGRLPGWIAHWRETNADPRTKIGRPQQLYVGPRRARRPGRRVPASRGPAFLERRAATALDAARRQACSAALSSMPSPVRGSTSTAPVSELRRNSRPGMPAELDGLHDARCRIRRRRSSSVTFVPAVT